MKKIGVLFVCMGNICRSPTAEAVFRHRVQAAGLSELILIDSAGTHDYHIGEPPDTRTQRAAAKRGYDMSALRGRQVSRHDFLHFDHILAMDHHNLSLLKQQCPTEHAHKLRLFLEFSENFGHEEMPDPYYGGASGFDLVLDLAEDAAQGLLQHLQSE